MEDKKYEVVLINDDRDEKIPKLAKALVVCVDDSCGLDYGSCSRTDCCIIDFS